MDQRFAAADAALKANRTDEAAALLQQALGENPKGPVGAYRQLAAVLFRAGRYDEARRWAEAGLEHYRRDYDLWNTLGVAHRRLRNTAQALKALDQAYKINPKGEAALSNRVNVLNDVGDPRALETALRLVRQSPANAEYQRMAAIAHRHQGDWEKARTRLEAALRLQPSLVQAWNDLCSMETTLQRHDAALAVIDRGLAANPGNRQMLENRIILLRRAGRFAEAERALVEALAANDAQAWVHHQLGKTVADAERERATGHYRRAVELEPDNRVYRTALIHNLDRARYGDEGANIQEAYEQLELLRAKGPLQDSDLFVARSLLQRVGDFETLKTLGSFSEVGRRFAVTNNHAALLTHLGRVETPEDRHELLEQHRIWGRTAEETAARAPITRPARTPRSGGKLRLGIVSSDLRDHPVGYFALPLFEHLDERFDLYCYSFNRGREDATQKYMASRSASFRWNPTISDRDAAQMIADDDLDILFELGGSTHMNKLEIMAYKPARLQASWMGYPHSVGLSTIDHIVVDPYMKPEDPRLLAEKPMMMPHTWLALGRAQFSDRTPVNPQMPEERNGFVTFGTANNPHKYGPLMLRTWARVVASVPGSQFLFVRPEGGTRRFRENMQAIFAEEGVAPERVRFTAVRGAHLPHYNEIDIALDTFPLTGGTTTCETVWMGVPLVSLIGEALFERLSYSVLTNAGLGDLAVRTLDDYVDTALKLAGDPARRRALRAGLRDQIRASPLGRTDLFAKDFYDLVARTVAVG